MNFYVVTQMAKSKAISNWFVKNVKLNMDIT